MNKPFSILIVPLIMGVLFSHYFEINRYFIFILLSFVIVALIYNIIKNAINQRVILVLFFLLGIFIGINGDRSLLINNIDKRLDYMGIVEETIKGEDDFNKYIVSVDYADNKSIMKEKIILNVTGNDRLHIGERIYFSGELRLPKENTNPRLFNYRLNLKTEKIHTTMSIKGHSITVINSENIALKYRLKSKFTDTIVNTFNTYLSEKNASLMTGIFLGQSSYLSSEDIDVYRDMGLAHLLAVSGLHIGIISGFISFVLSNLGIKRRINIIITLSTIWIYGYLIGFPPSILRSSIMFTILYYSQLIHEPYDSINSLSLAMFILLIINPYYIFNLGFQLSFAATFSILIFTPRIRQGFYPFKNKITQSLSSILGVQIGLLPFQAYYFNNINLISLIANLIIIPIISFSLILGFLMIIFTNLHGINGLIGIILENLLNIEGIMLNWLNGININSFKVFSPEIITGIIFYIILFIIFDLINIKKLDKIMVKVVAVYLILLTMINIYSIINDKSTELHFIDVGQGDSILIRTKRADYLMDTGGSFFGDYNIAEGITIPYLEKLGINKLEGLFITHFDADHSQGVPLILDILDVRYLFSTYLPDDEEMLNSIKSSDAKSIILKENDKLKLDDSITLDIIWPNTSNLDSNNSSMVSILRTNGTNILLTGDIEREAEYLIKDKIIDDIHIIKVPHHGSNTSSTDEFLQSIRPQDAIIQVGRNNLYNHPSDEVLNRYNSLGAAVYRTDNMGLVKVIIDENDYEIETYLKDSEKPKPNLSTYIYDNIVYLMAYVLYFVLIYIMVKISSYKGDEVYDLQ
ncbi:MAG: DNA internalization-related competence protein ComEC/Rec2 [Tissierella sp.]|nr:DNA internalization-related competence protein ComEC/Rec2 [Tissierella sp.]